METEFKLDENTEKYLKSMRYEINKLNKNQFTGNRTFKLNFKEGVIKNMNVNMEKLVKF